MKSIGNPFAPPPQPPAPPSDAAYQPVTSPNPFALYDAGIDEDGADGNTWESEPAGTRSAPRFWQPRFYSTYFDINVTDFVTRTCRALFPCKPLLGWVDADEEAAGGTCVPDLYGPFWVTTTLVLALSMGAESARFLADVFHLRESVFAPSISTLNLSKLWRAAGILYFYVFIFPVLLTVFQCLFAKRSLAESSVSAHPIVGTVMVYGYSMTPVVVAAFVATVPVDMVQIVAMTIAFGIGALVIMLNLWRDVSVQHKSLTYFVRLLAAFAHAALGVTLVFMFFISR